MSKPSVMTLALLMGLSTTGCITGVGYEQKALEGDLEALEMFTTDTYNSGWWDGQKSIREVLRSNTTPLEARQRAMELTKLDSKQGIGSMVYVANDAKAPEALRLQALKCLEEHADNANVKKFFIDGDLAFFDGVSRFTSLNKDSGAFFLKHLSNLDRIAQVVTARKYSGMTGKYDGDYRLDDYVIQEGLVGRADKELLQLIKQLVDQHPNRIQSIAACLKDETAIAAYVVLYSNKSYVFNSYVVDKITSQALIGKLVTNPKVDLRTRQQLFPKVTEQEPLLAIAKNESADAVFRRAAILKLEDAATKSELAMAVLPSFYGGAPKDNEHGLTIYRYDEIKFIFTLAKLIQNEDFLFEAGGNFQDKELKEAVWGLVSSETWTRKAKDNQLKDEAQLLFALSKVTDPTFLQAIVDNASYSETVRNKAGNQLCDWEAIQKEVFELPN